MVTVPTPGESNPSLREIRETSGDTAEQGSPEKNLPANHFHRMLALIKSSYFETDLAGRLTFFNEYVCKLHGRSAEELRRLHSRDFIAPEQFQKVYAVWDTVYRTGTPSDAIQYDIIRKNGSRASVETAVSLLRDPQGKPIGFCGISRDITERKRAEKALR
ncbi:MAG: PAS domain S-box protein, partial [Desulfatitalea sp.]|nr:PAS domain S-box protein [Desulfatitalea sp.]